MGALAERDLRALLTGAQVLAGIDESDGEKHLQHVYDKLGVRGRRELRRSLQ